MQQILTFLRLRREVLFEAQSESQHHVTQCHSSIIQALDRINRRAFQNLVAKLFRQYKFDNCNIHLLIDNFKKTWILIKATLYWQPNQIVIHNSC